MQKPKVAIIGAGNVGSILAKAFYCHGYPLVGIVSKTMMAAEKLAKDFHVKATIRAADITKYADVIILATPDRYISQVVEEIAEDGGFRVGQFVLHTAGSLSNEVLCAASDMGAFTGCMHPLQSFSDRERGIELLVGTYFALGGHEQAVKLGARIAQDFGGKSFILGDEERPLYHASACIVSNYLVSLLHWAMNNYESIGLSPRQAQDALLPLVQGTIQNIQALGPMGALTGPVSRGDSNTIKAHLDIMKNQEERQLYVALAHYTLGIAVNKGTVDAKQMMVMKEVLNQGVEGLS